MTKHGSRRSAFGRNQPVAWIKKEGEFGLLLPEPYELPRLRAAVS